MGLDYKLVLMNTVTCTVGPVRFEIISQSSPALNKQPHNHELFFFFFSRIVFLNTHNHKLLLEIFYILKYSLVILIIL